MSDALQQLDKKVQKWVYQQGWPDLRPIQQKSVAPIMAGQQDIVISASTAAGKTEAFFLPACSVLQAAASDTTEGFGILYISPLKALINDQYRRLESLCDLLDMQLTPWHGDSAQSKKRKARMAPSGILLITPESLESLFVRKVGWVAEVFAGLHYIVIDEFHAFIGSERGHHLLSLLNRLDALLQRDTPIPRVALSATLSELSKVPKSLRPNSDFPYQIITDEHGQSRLKLQVRGYVNPATLEDEQQTTAEIAICRDLYQICRTEFHLIFANKRSNCENIAAQLSDFCLQNHLPNEFFPHHGSLAKELRETLEARLQKETVPTTAVCTMTLELGIDIGQINAVAQVTPPQTVAGLRQRMGRSGRRGDPAILRLFIEENQLTVRSGVTDKLRMGLLQSVAMTRLLVAEQWFEPADEQQYHFSTLLHQILAVIGQWGGVTAQQLYHLLGETGPFRPVCIDHFKQLLTHMGSIDLLTQLSSGELVLGIEGERIVGHYTFYAVFHTPAEYRIINNGKTLGSLPILSPIMENQHITFAGRRWKITDIDTKNRTIQVTATQGGKPPLFGGEGIEVHDRIRQEMFEILRSGEHRIGSGDQLIDFVDDTGRELLAESQQYFTQLNLAEQHLFQQGETVYLVPWLGDKKVNTLKMLLVSEDYEANAFAGVIEIKDCQVSAVRDTLMTLLSKELPTNTELAQRVLNKSQDKFSHLLPPELINLDFGQRAFDVSGTLAWLRQTFG